MSRLPVLSSKQIIKALTKAGFTYAPKQGKGSHVALYKTDPTGRKLLTIVPPKKRSTQGDFTVHLAAGGAY